MYKRLRRWLNAAYPYVYPAPKPMRAECTVEIGENNTATIHLGDKSFQIHSQLDTPLTHQNYDFALYGAVALALSHNIELHSDLPISKSCYESILKIHRAFRILNPIGIYVQPITLTNIVEDEAFKENAPGLICMSGGIDSTFSAIEIAQQSNYTHGMLLAGADYPSVDSEGFKELAARVNIICQTVNMTLLVVETTIRNHNVNWDMLHGLCLIMCQRFHASIFGKGAMAADFIAVQEVAMGPWGNSQAIIEPLSTPSFPIEHVGRSTFRSDKLKAILQAHPQLINELSVCYTHKKTAGNCGECRKCVRMMLSLYTLGVDYKEHFLTDRDLVSLLNNPPRVPDSQTIRRLVLGWYIEEEYRLPEGEIKDAINRYILKLSREILPQGD